MQNIVQLKQSIESCWTCRAECQELLYNYCLPMGGEYANPEHVSLMTDCIAICQTAADFMTRESSHHWDVCLACAEICEACAASCAKIQSREMQHCARICLACAAACRHMTTNVYYKKAA